jgi:hypothetical protein
VGVGENIIVIFVITKIVPFGFDSGGRKIFLFLDFEGYFGILKEA